LSWLKIVSDSKKIEQLDLTHEKIMERGFKKMIENKNKISIDEETRKENLLINTTSVQSGLREVNSN